MKTIIERGPSTVDSTFARPARPNPMRSIRPSPTSKWRFNFDRADGDHPVCLHEVPGGHGCRRKCDLRLGDHWTIKGPQPWALVGDEQTHRSDAQTTFRDQLGYGSEDAPEVSTEDTCLFESRRTTPLAGQAHSLTVATLYAACRESVTMPSWRDRVGGVRLGEQFKHFDRRPPAETSVSNALPIGEIRSTSEDEVLAAPD